MAVLQSNDDTIFALSSGLPPAAIAIVRISGDRAEEIAVAMAGSRPAYRHATLRTLKSMAGIALDRALVIIFAAPHTATGETLVEYHLHGGRAVVDAVLRDLAARGLRHAEPGEFTRRALLNGRMDLDAVEGLADLLAAETEAQRREALSRSEGVLGRQLEGWKNQLLMLAARVEAAIDFDGDAEVEPEDMILRKDITSLADNIGRALAIPPAERLRDGIRVVIIGPPNTGKSTLFNTLVGHEAAIVSPIAGTTRDSIERPVAIAGLPFLLVDTAGLHETSDVIERLGIERATYEKARADIILDLGDSTLAHDHPAAVITLSAKCDIIDAAPGTLAISSQTGEGLDRLVRRMTDMGQQLLPNPGEVALGRRHRRELAHLRQQLRLASRSVDPLIQAEHLRDGRMALDRLTGDAGVEDMLDALFGRFCLGK